MCTVVRNMLAYAVIDLMLGGAYGDLSASDWLEVSEEAVKSF